MNRSRSYIHPVFIPIVNTPVVGEPRIVEKLATNSTAQTNPPGPLYTRGRNSRCNQREKRRCWHHQHCWEAGQAGQDRAAIYPKLRAQAGTHFTSGRRRWQHLIWFLASKHTPPAHTKSWWPRSSSKHHNADCSALDGPPRGEELTRAMLVLVDLCLAPVALLAKTY